MLMSDFGSSDLQCRAFTGVAQSLFIGFATFRAIENNPNSHVISEVKESVLDACRYKQEGAFLNLYGVLAIEEFA